MKTALKNNNNFGWLIGVMIVLLFTGCNQIKAQNKGNEPNIHIEVHRKTDKNGHVIAYDSTYSYSYADTTGIPGMMNRDSLMEAMRNRMQQQFFGNSMMPGMGFVFKGMDGSPFAQMDSIMRNMMQNNGAFIGMPRMFQFQNPHLAAPSDSLIPTPPSWKNEQQQKPKKKAKVQKQSMRYPIL